MKNLTGRERLYLGIFIVALIWGVYNYRHVIFQADTATPATPAATVAATTPEQAVPVVTRAAIVDYTPPEWLADPFHRDWRHGARPAEVSRAKPVPLTLSAVVVRDQVRYAVINGRIVREGQMIEGRRVLAIEDSGVLVDDNGVEVTLTL